MSFYFRGVPDFEYPLSENYKFTQVKNLFKRNKIRDDIFNNLVYFTKYNIIGDERPEQIAEKFYDDVTLDWVILISNNIVNVREQWPLDGNSFNNMIEEKYKNIYDIHHYETKEIRTSNGIVVLPKGLKIEKTWRTNGNFVAANEKIISQIFCNSIGTVTVTLNDGLFKLKPGNSITISNVEDDAYNGTFRVTSVFIPFEDEVVTSFTYSVDNLPQKFNPVITSNNKETATMIIKDNLMFGNSYYFEYYDQEKFNRIGNTMFLTEVTNYDYELIKNNKKREINILKPNYMGIVLNDSEKYKSYKIGGDQYVSENLKRGDNPKLYN